MQGSRSPGPAFVTRNDPSRKGSLLVDKTIYYAEASMHGKLREVMTREVITLSPSDTILAAAQQMKARDVGSMPVCGNEGTVVGTLTDRDITIRVIAEGMDPEQTRVDSIMTRDVVCAEENQEIDDA